MWIKLISPKMSHRPMDTSLKTQMAPPLALLTLGALTPDRHRVTLADENVEWVSFRDRPDLVALTVKADTADRSFRIAARYRESGVPVILGGIHPTACPEDCLLHADAVAVGEAELTWPRILQDAEAGRLHGIYRQDAPTDQAMCPVPRWELVAGKNYLFVNTLTAGRGCPWSCDFCYNSAENVARGHRMKPVANILREIESLGVRHVFFIDDNFIGNPARARELLLALRPLGLTWHTAVSADIGRRPELLDLMTESGCRSLFIGFETISAENLRACSKRQNAVEEYDATIAAIHARGIMVNASVVFGFDSDDGGVFGRTLGWLVRNRVETMTGHILTPYPGTRLYRRLHDEGRIIDFDLTHYNTSRAVFRPARMSAGELEAGYRGIYRDFYALGNIARRLPEARAQWMPYLLFNLGYRKLGPVVAGLGRLGLMGLIGRLGRSWSYPGGGSRAVHPAVVAPAGGQPGKKSSAAAERGGGLEETGVRVYAAGSE